LVAGEVHSAGSRGAFKSGQQPNDADDKGRASGAADSHCKNGTEHGGWVPLQEKEACKGVFSRSKGNEMRERRQMGIDPRGELKRRKRDRFMKERG